eukprot:GHVQ01024925.1.p4 GENE.GHVQ01024925.1~~GHVQ01024925.1.p4  ORF type:complete len:123 (-),score=22.33 GHVQ01024925.1:275-643(-)
MEGSCAPAKPCFMSGRHRGTYSAARRQRAQQSQKRIHLTDSDEQAEEDPARSSSLIENVLHSRRQPCALKAVGKQRTEHVSEPEGEEDVCVLDTSYPQRRRAKGVMCGTTAEQLLKTSDMNP